MTGMLASVTSVAEVEIVLDEGVDIIDLKNPQKGVLGALATTTLSEIVRTVDAAVPVSATVGDISPTDPTLSDTIIKVAETGVDIVKVGLFDDKPDNYFIETIKNVIKQDIRLVVVLFAEDYIKTEPYHVLMQSGITGIMLDTKNKTGLNLTNIVQTNRLKEFVDMAKTYKLISGLAGSLHYADIDCLLPIRPDYLGFRGALCSNENRTKQIDRNRIRKIRQAIPIPDETNFEQGGLQHGTVA